MSDDIFGPLSRDTCPDCGNHGFRSGPRGGLSQNVECLRCSHRFNITRWQGNLVWAERIASRSEGGPEWLNDYSQFEKLEELACAIGDAIANFGARPETWLTDDARGRIVASEAIRIMIERNVRL